MIKFSLLDSAGCGNMWLHLIEDINAASLPTTMSKDKVQIPELDVNKTCNNVRQVS